MQGRTIILTTFVLVALLASCSALPARKKASNGQVQRRQVDTSSASLSVSTPDNTVQTSDVSTQLNGATTGISGQISNAASNIGEQISDTTSDISSTVSDAYNGISKKFSDVSTGVSGQISDVERQVGDATSDFSDQMSSAASGVYDQASNAMSSVSKKFNEGVQGIQTQLTGVASGAVTNEQPLSGQLPPQLGNIGQPGIAKVQSFFNKMFGFRNGMNVPNLGMMGSGRFDPQEIQKLQEFLSLEVNNKDKFAEIYSRMTPDEVKKIRELVLKIGQKVNNPELIQFGQNDAQSFSQGDVNVLLGLGQATYERLSAVGAMNRAANYAGKVDPQQLFQYIKMKISGEQDFIQKLVNMIEVQLTKAPQIDQQEFADFEAMIQKIRTLSSQIQSQLGQATDMSQLEALRPTLLEIQDLAGKIQEKVTAEVLEERMKATMNAVTSGSTSTSTGSTSTNTVEVQTTDA